jgi:secernin
MSDPIPLTGCDTLIATPSATLDGGVLFAKNSDRHPDECQHLRLYAARKWALGERVRCQYLAIPQTRRTHRVLGGQPCWLWGFEQGVNEHGVVIGNEAIWTRAARQETGLLGMDLVRLGLERGATAREALEVMAALLAEYGQGGSPRHHDPAAPCYDNSFILADPREAWVLETSGREWAARRVEGVYSISNTPSIGARFDAASPALRDRPGLDFARDLGDYENHPQTSGRLRCARSHSLLQARPGRLRVRDMMAFLRDHGGDPDWHPGFNDHPTICMHSDTGQTAASLVVHLRAERFTAWCSLGIPCVSVFLPFFIGAEVPAPLARGGTSFSADSPWWRIKRLARFAAEDWPTRYPRIRACWDPWEQELLRQAPEYATASAAVKNEWIDGNVGRFLRYLEELEGELGLRV